MSDGAGGDPPVRAGAADPAARERRNLVEQIHTGDEALPLVAMRTDRLIAGFLHGLPGGTVVETTRPRRRGQGVVPRRMGADLV
jgi:hypothetical protein